MNQTILSEKGPKKEGGKARVFIIINQEDTYKEKQKGKSNWLWKYDINLI